MKKASFSATISSPSGQYSSTAYGVVTLKDDNKVSISIYDRKYQSSRLVAHATQIAKEIVASDFNHPSITGEVVSTDSGLIGLLTKETAQLKEELMTRTQESAVLNFNIVVSKIDSVKSQLEAVVSAYNEALKAKSNEMYSLRRDYDNVSKKLTKMRSIMKMGLDAFVEEAMKNAEAHYSDSLYKLAERINQKGLDMSNFRMISGYVGINLEMTMTDGVKSVSAWTIWAAQDSELVSPHYRYLVK